MSIKDLIAAARGGGIRALDPVTGFTMTWAQLANAAEKELEALEKARNWVMGNGRIQEMQRQLAAQPRIDLEALRKALADHFSDDTQHHEALAAEKHLRSLLAQLEGSAASKRVLTPNKELDRQVEEMMLEGAKADFDPLICPPIEGDWRGPHGPLPKPEGAKGQPQTFRVHEVCIFCGRGNCGVPEHAPKPEEQTWEDNPKRVNFSIDSLLKEFAEEKAQTCPECIFGRVELYGRTTTICAACNGTGQIPPPAQTCPTCGHHQLVHRQDGRCRIDPCGCNGTGKVGGGRR